MNTTEWFDTVAYVSKMDSSNFAMDVGDTPDAYFSKYDDSYITFVGLENDSLFEYLAEHEVVEDLTTGVGFSPKENKWYGWSHRAIYGFTIGSTCIKGSTHYTEERGEWVAKTMEDAKQMAIDFHRGCS